MRNASLVHVQMSMQQENTSGHELTGLTSDIASRRRRCITLSPVHAAIGSLEPVKDYHGLAVAPAVKAGATDCTHFGRRYPAA